MLLHLATPDGRTIDWTPFAPAPSFSLWWRHVYELRWLPSLLPSNATTWSRAVEVVDADLVARAPVGLIASARMVLTCPAQLVAHLAEERSVDEFSSAWPEERQRAAVAASFALHQRKGSRPAVDRALRPLGFAPRVVEWFEAPGRQVNTFRVAIEIAPEREWLGHQRRELIGQINTAKNAHTKLEALELRRRAGPAAIRIGGLPVFKRALRVGQQVRPNLIRQTTMTWVGAAQMRRRTLRISQKAS